jgi:hypothetical protein
VKLLPRHRVRVWASILAGLAVVISALLIADARLVYLFRGEYLGHADVTPRVIDLSLPGPDKLAGGLVTANLDGDEQRDFIVTGVGYVAAFAASGEGLWFREVDLQVTSHAESDGLPGLHAPGVQIADSDGDGATEVLFLTRGGSLLVVDGASGTPEQEIELPPPPAEAERWEHLVIADFRGSGDRDLLLQATNKEGYRMGRFLAAYALERLLLGDTEAALLWARDDFLALAHGGARIADLDGDGRHEVLGGDLIGPDGKRRFRVPVGSGAHLDSLYVADIRPDLPGLEVVTLEENAGERVFLYGHEGVIWETDLKRQEPQNAAVGDFDPDRPGLEIWCRSRYNRDQRPFVFDARGQVIADYEMSAVAPKGWTVSGVEEIFVIDWTGRHKQLAAAKERHDAGDVAIFDPLTGAFLLRLDERADRLYVADVTGDWREEIVVWQRGQLRVYANPASNPRPDRPRLWQSDDYRRSKVTWNYYSP